MPAPASPPIRALRFARRCRRSGADVALEVPIYGVPMADFPTLRRMMVDGQVRTADVTSRALIEAMLEVPRERFAPGEAALAYLDLDLPVGSGGQRRLLKPMVLARMLQTLDLAEGEKVLDVGCATGYAAALMARLAGEVVALEQDPELLSRAKDAFATLGIANVRAVQGRLVDGYKADSPYDAILVEGCIEIEPAALCAQLADGGRLVCIQGAGPAAKAVICRRDGDDITERAVFDANAAALPGFAKAPSFVF
jgi:protein-L-isoaspartate(D-aspartate) O-methyltransferase